MSYGCISRLGPTTLEITELPIRTWTQSYKESVLEPMLMGSEKSPPFIRYIIIVINFNDNGFLVITRSTIQIQLLSL